MCETACGILPHGINMCSGQNW